MVSVSVRSSRTASHIIDGDIVLSNERTILLSDIPGKTGSRQWLNRLDDMAQAKMDDRRLIADLPTNDPDRIHAEAADDAWFTERYGERMFIDGDSLVTRTDKITFTFEQVEDENGTLVGPILRSHVEVVK